jgi:large subunit ribosomal protein L32
MPNPKRKHTRSRRDSRRAQNWKLDLAAFSPCGNPACGKLRAPHVVCPHCGYYKDRIVIAQKTGKADEGGAQEQK